MRNIDKSIVDYLFCKTINKENIASAVKELGKFEYIRRKAAFVKKYRFNLVDGKRCPSTCETNLLVAHFFKLISENHSVSG